MDIYTTLKCVRVLINKKCEEKPDGGIKTQIDGDTVRIKYTDLLDQMDELIGLAREKRLREVKLCRDCKDWSCAPNAKVAPCLPTNYTSSRKRDDFCSLCIERVKKE